MELIDIILGVINVGGRKQIFWASGWQSGQYQNGKSDISRLPTLVNGLPKHCHQSPVYAPPHLILTYPWSLPPYFYHCPEYFLSDPRICPSTRRIFFTVYNFVFLPPRIYHHPDYCPFHSEFCYWPELYLPPPLLPQVMDQIFHQNFITGFEHVTQDMLTWKLQFFNSFTNEEKLWR